MDLQVGGAFRQAVIELAEMQYPPLAEPQQVMFLCWGSLRSPQPAKLGVEAGAHILRVHDVRATKDALCIREAYEKV